MKAKLISYTRPAEDLIDGGIDSPEELIAFCARVSNPANQYNTETSTKLVKYLIKHKHWSPLDMVDITIEIEPTRDIGRQMLRHQSFKWQEFSQRYSSIEDLNDMFEISECRLQDDKNRQNSIVLDVSNPEHRELSRLWLEKQQEVIRLTRETYLWALNNGVAKEVARKVLPEGLTKTRMYMKGSVRSWIHYLEVRLDESTQKEHRDIALILSEIIATIFPIEDYTKA
jgi:thymidylate synthase (FAD)